MPTTGIIVLPSDKFKIQINQIKYYTTEVCFWRFSKNVF